MTASAVEVVVRWSLALLAAAALMTQPAPSGNESSSRGSPLVEVVSRDEEDKGIVPLGEHVGRRVVIRNISEWPVRMTVASKSCPCMNPRADPERVPAGQTTTLWFEIAALGTQEQQHYTTTFKAVAEAGGRRLTQEVIAGLRYSTAFEYVVKPGRLNLATHQDEPIDARVFLQFVERDQYRPEKCESPWPCLSAQPEDSPIVEGENASWPVHVRGTFDTIGVQSGMLKFAVGGAKASGVEVPITVRVLPRWTAAPPGVVLDLRSAQGVVRTRLVLRELGPDPHGGCPRLRLTCNSPGVTGQVVDAQGEAAAQIDVDTSRASGPSVTTFELLDQRGRIVGEVPVVLYRPSGPG
jgi:hypothetical protein